MKFDSNSFVLHWFLLVQREAVLPVGGRVGEGREEKKKKKREGEEGKKKKLCLAFPSTLKIPTYNQLYPS